MIDYLKYEFENYMNLNIVTYAIPKNTRYLITTSSLQTKFPFEPEAYMEGKFL